MKKAIYKTNYMMRELKEPEKESLIGFEPGYLWKSVEYFRGPKKTGRYFVIKKDGQIAEMLCTGTHSNEEEARTVFNLAADVDYGSTAYIDGREMTDTDLMNLRRSPWGIWYTLDCWQDYDNYGTDVNVYTDNSEEYPLYFLDLNLEENIELDENGEIKGVTDVQYYKHDKDGNLIREEEN